MQHHTRPSPYLQRADESRAIRWQHAGLRLEIHEWSPAGDWVVYGVDRGGNEREGYYLIAPDGTRERELLAPSEAFRVFGGFTRDGRRIAYATTERNGRDFDIHLLDVSTGQDREVYRGRMGLYAVSCAAAQGFTPMRRGARVENASRLVSHLQAALAADAFGSRPGPPMVLTIGVLHARSQGPTEALPRIMTPERDTVELPADSPHPSA